MQDFLKHEEKIILDKWKGWRFKNTFLLILSLVVFFYLAKTPFVENGIQKIGTLGYLGAFLTGIFFVSSFTVAPAAVVLFHLAENLNALEVALLAGAGGVIGDYLIFRFLKDRVFSELAPVLHKLKMPKVRGIFRSPYFAWFPPVFGAVIIASPFPDEVGLSML